MAKDTARAASVRDKGRRRLEVLALVLPSLLIVVGTITYLVCKRMDNSKVDYFCTNSSNQHTENITGAESEDNGSLRTKDGMVYPPGSYWTSDNGTAWGCPCLLKPCLHKCCGKEETIFYQDYEEEGNTNDNNTENTENEYEEEENERIPCCDTLNVTFDARRRGIYSKNNFVSPEQVQLEDDHFFLIYDGCQGRPHVGSSKEENNSYFLLEDGRLLRKKSQNYSLDIWDSNDFCTDMTNESKAIHFWICYDETRKEHSQWVSLRGVGIVLSVPFLFATVMVYALLPPLQNLHGKALIWHVASLAVAYSGLALTQLFSNWFHHGHLGICKAAAFTIQFTLLTSFCWLNVMCFDIWWVFSGLMPLRGSQKVAEQIKFRLYSMYAWGCPVVILTLSLIMEYAPGIPFTAIRPEMGVNNCFFKENDARLLYLYLPIGVWVYLNVVMFLATSLRFKSHSNSVKRLERGDSRRHCKSKVTSDMQRFSLYLKLFIVMGLNWILELLSFIAHSDSVFWLAVDVSNALQGVLIFYIFICKRRILIMLRQRYGGGRAIFTDVSVKNTYSSRSTGSAKLSTLPRKNSNKAETLSTTNDTESPA